MEGIWEGKRESKGDNVALDEMLEGSLGTSETERETDVKVSLLINPG